MGIKILKLLQLFSGEEIKILLEFIQSPYFVSIKKQRRLVPLLKLFLKSLKSGKALKPDEVYEEVFPNEQIVLGKLEREMTKLYRLIEEFIEVHFSDSFYSKQVRNLTRLGFLGDRKALGEFEKLIKKLRKEQNRVEVFDDNLLFTKFLLEQENEKLNSRFNTRASDLNLPVALESLDVYFFYNRLKITVSILAQNIHTKIKVEPAIRLIDLNQSFLEGEEYLQIPVVKVYLSAFRLLRSYGEEDNDAYLEFKTILKNNIKQFSVSEGKSLQTLLRIYSVSQYNSGNKKYLQEAFDLYQEHLASGFLYFDNKLMPATLRAIVILGLRLQEFEWVFNLIKTHKNKIGGTHQSEDVINFNLAYYYFKKKDYEKALEFLTDQYEDHYYKIGAKRIEIMIFYEQKSVLLEHKMDAFKIYIYRISKKNLPERSKQASNNFIDILKQILNPQTHKNAARILKVRENIKDRKMVAEREWLFEKLEEQQ